MSGDLERRYRRVLRLLPRYYRDQREEDMVAAFLDSWLTGDPDTDAYITRAAGPSWAEIGSVASLATTWHGAWPAVDGDVNLVWIAVFVALVLGRWRIARPLAVLVIVPDLVTLLQRPAHGTLLMPFGSWAFWFLFDLGPVLALTAFHRDAPPAARWPWLLALPAGYLLLCVPPLVFQATGATSAWLPDFSGQLCLVVALACLARAPRARSGRSGDSGAWSLTLLLLAVAAGLYRIVSLSDYQHDPHLITAGLAELLILVAAVALVAPDAARAQTPAATPPAAGSPPPMSTR